MTRAEHLEWAKKRALEYLDSGDKNNAIVSMLSDLEKHGELQGHVGITLGAMMLFADQFKTSADVRHFIEGFN